ncbi:PP2C family protein-serine/threonine phosphatase [Streptoalloteichus hindustanus]|uniref:PPM-type phosphatase domain-containing protein n=1 Tax=Streptoalloteichus hindustanus TaxID=2017 RepID=A0A1M5EQ99_STRHI|nr:hypothetical protein [Streptoalloteichus hindustanus]SHF81468.1 hypothetical protein SAMN05444320_10587 [Streptoalloteichus hindustanus]
MTAAVAAAQRTPLLGIVAAAELCGEPVLGERRPTGAIVVATAWPGQGWVVSWAGDSAAYSYQPKRECGRGVRRLTVPHTHGQLMRERGKPEEEARRWDSRIYNSLASSVHVGIRAISSDAPYLVLATDGLRLPADRIEAVLREHLSDPVLCADQLLKEARTRSRDDIAVVVVPHPHPVDERG